MYHIHHCEGLRPQAAFHDPSLLFSKHGMSSERCVSSVKRGFICVQTDDKATFGNQAFTNL